MVTNKPLNLSGNTTIFPDIKRSPLVSDVEYLDIVKYEPDRNMFVTTSGLLYTGWQLKAMGYSVHGIIKQLKTKRANQMANIVHKFLVLDTYGDVVDKCLTEEEALAKLAHRGAGIS